MDERLTELKTRLNLKWCELADKMGISVGMLGFLRRGVRRPTPKILATISALESDTKNATSSQQVQHHATKESQARISLEIENRRLKEENASLQGEIKGL